MKALQTAIVFIAALLPFHAFAAPMEVTFEALDGNGDGYVSRDEVPADHELARDFSSYDSDADGRLSSGEFERFKSTAETTEDV